MCIICKDWLLGKLTVDEAFRNLSEMFESANENDMDHYWELAEELTEERNRPKQS